MKYLKLLAFLPLLFALPACESVQQSVTDTYYTLRDNGASAIDQATGASSSSDKLIAKGGCPAVEIAEDLGSFYDFGGGKPSPDNLISRVEMSKQSACVYGPKSVTVDVRIGFQGALGPKGRMKSHDEPFISYPYFVAILAPGGKILAKEVFALPLTYFPGSETQGHVENLRQIIPVHSEASGAAHKVVVGFQLSKEQLSYNREVLKQRKSGQLARSRAERTKYQGHPGMKPAAPPTAAVDAAIDGPAPGTPVATDPNDSGPIILAPAPEEKKKLNQ